MNRTERFYKIDQLLLSHRVLTRQALLDALNVSWATLKRDLAYLKDRFNAPIIFDYQAGGYRFATPNAGPTYELPGLWFSAEETYALLTMHKLLSELEPGLLSPHIDPLLARLNAILSEDATIGIEDINQRIQVATIGKRRKNPVYFASVSRATLASRQIEVRHYSREKDQYSDRVLSPQRLMFYRNNWYLDAWCHERQALRRFSVDAFQSVNLLDVAAHTVSPEALKESDAGNYGIFSGVNSKTAQLRFSPEAARWVADEQWHPDQSGRFDLEGFYILEFPYAKSDELIMDILRHGHHVEVLAPNELRHQLCSALQPIMQIYEPAER